MLKNKTYRVSWNAVTDATNYNLKEVKTPSCGSVQTTTYAITTSGTTSKAFTASVVTGSGTEMSVSADYTVQACTGTNCGGCWIALTGAATYEDARTACRTDRPITDTRPGELLCEMPTIAAWESPGLGK